jgi:hypothetical protein
MAAGVIWLDLAKLHLSHMQMCRVADMWGVPTCLQRCFNALSQLKEGKVDVDDLAEIYSWLPDSVTTLPSYSEWETQVQARVVQVFQDVYTLLTTHKLLQRFRSLPFQAVLAWAGSDKLVIDSENSVAVAISWWYGGEEGSQATEDQLEELSGALRLKHLSNGRDSKDATCQNACSCRLDTSSHESGPLLKCVSSCLGDCFRDCLLMYHLYSITMQHTA